MFGVLGDLLEVCDPNVGAAHGVGDHRLKRRCREGRHVRKGWLVRVKQPPASQIASSSRSHIASTFAGLSMSPEPETPGR